MGDAMTETVRNTYDTLKQAKGVVDATMAAYPKIARFGMSGSDGAGRFFAEVTFDHDRAEPAAREDHIWPDGKGSYAVTTTEFLGA